jgi:ketosteroid isomerase-like protein
MSNEPAKRGREAARKGFASMFVPGTVKEFDLKTDDVAVGGDLAVETGAYEMTLQPKGAKEVKDKGKYITVWKRQPDGSWKIVRDRVNSDLPMTS